MIINRKPKMDRCVMDERVWMHGWMDGCVLEG